MAPDRKQRWTNGLDWPAVLWIGVVHVCALAAPFFFTWKALGIFFVLSWITGGLGICLGYHRLLAHGSFQTYRFLRRLIALCGALAGEGPPITWVAVHRKHHLNSDAEGDPHSPHDGGLVESRALAVSASPRPRLATNDALVWKRLVARRLYAIVGQDISALALRLGSDASFRGVDRLEFLYRHVVFTVGSFLALGVGDARHMAGKLRLAYVGL